MALAAYSQYSFCSRPVWAALRALDFFGTGFGDDVTCDYFSVVTCGFRVASVWLPSTLVDGDAIS
eukprot:COSAG01_NODE_1467_length_10217_cov_33.824570_8_plen_65_part_00